MKAYFNSFVPGTNSGLLQDEPVADRTFKIQCRDYYQHYLSANIVLLIFIFYYVKWLARSVFFHLGERFL
jgi:hypothetical protein